jgi:hypothetical protein
MPPEDHLPQRKTIQCSLVKHTKDNNWKALILDDGPYAASRYHKVMQVNLISARHLGQEKQHDAINEEGGRKEYQIGVFSPAVIGPKDAPYLV